MFPKVEGRRVRKEGSVGAGGGAYVLGGWGGEAGAVFLGGGGQMKRGGKKRYLDDFSAPHSPPHPNPHPQTHKKKHPPQKKKTTPPQVLLGGCVFLFWSQLVFCFDVCLLCLFFFVWWGVFPGVRGGWWVFWLGFVFLGYCDRFVGLGWGFC